ncbi:Ng1 interacting factor Nif3 like protein [Zymoseptoria brevis]|uniref:Ng1 interacting factor Nif3 like protein n=1 Tax=Zymoseptoria brevis TaxID=1047168 RepID=A0A0F4G5Y7_9PEZI|nr:Ng1 interacting factor Nif3 like protein [Zymoseptoria brevis]
MSLSGITRRAYSKMASPPTTSPYTRAVVNAMRRLYPEALADKSFDNTGLLLESPFSPARRQNNSVLLTIDLTKAVADEAIRRKDSIVVAYHPIIFRGLKSLTLRDTQQQSLLRLAAEGISVYSPHTAVDAAKGGLGDWLADIITGEPTSTATSSSSSTNANNTPDTPTKKSKRPTLSLSHHPSQLSLKEESTFTPAHHPHKRYPITPTKVSGHEHGGGMGRIIHLDTPVPLPSLLDRISAGLNNPAAFPIAIPQGRTASDITIRSIALCAGSGGGLFSEAEKQGEDVDLYFTGELSHHEALAATEKGKVVVALFHSNSERGFLHAVLKGQLEEAIPEEWEKVRKERSGNGAEEVLEGEHEGVFVSEVDRDPYGIMISKTGL